MRVGTKQRKRRESNPQGSGHRPKGGRARFRAGCRHPSACPSGIHQTPGEGLEPPRRRRLINSEVRLPFRHPGKGKLCTEVGGASRPQESVPLLFLLGCLFSPISCSVFAALAAKKSGWLGSNQRFPAPEAGGLAIFPTPRGSAQRESNPHVRHGEARGCHYIMGTATVAELSKRPRAPGGGRTHVTALRERCLAC